MTSLPSMLIRDNAETASLDRIEALVDTLEQAEWSAAPDCYRLLKHETLIQLKHEIAAARLTLAPTRTR